MKRGPDYSLRHWPVAGGRRGGGRRRGGGYSLVEVLMTCLIIQIIAGMVAVSVSSVASSERTSYAGQEVVTAIRYARQLAQTTGTPCGVIFDTVNQQVKVFRGNTSTIATNANMPGGRYIVSLGQQANTHGVTLTSVSLAGSANNNVLTYGNIGTISGMPKGLGSTVNSGFVTLSLGGAAKTVTIPAAGEPTLN
jgi:Tfp pilus assembly protein FimT